MTDSFDELWRKFDEGIVDEQMPECEWSQDQIQAVERFRMLFGIPYQRHDYYEVRSGRFMEVRFTRIPRGKASQFYSVELAVNDEKAARGRRGTGQEVRGIYLNLDGQKNSRQLSDEQVDAIIQLYNSIKPANDES